MSKQIDISDSLVFNPTGYTGQTNIANENTTYPWSRGYNSVSHTANYARLQLSSSDTSTNCYFYYTFSISGIPSNATITSVACSTRISRNSRVGSSTLQLYSGTTAKGGATTFSSTTTTGSNVTPTNIANTGSWTVSELSNMRLRITGRRTNTNQTGYIYVWGTDLTVTYTISGTAYEITATLATDTVDSISPAGYTEVFQGNDYELEIYAASIDDILVEDNGADVTSQLVEHTLTPYSDVVNATAESLSTGFSGGSSMNFYTSSSSTGHNFNYAVGHTAESPGSTSSGSGSWTYVKEGGRSTTNTGYADFVFDFSEIPANASITSVQVKCYGAIESTSEDTGHADITLFSGNTQKGTMQRFTSTYNSIIAISSPGTWTREELQSAKLRFTVGYYGGHIFGITWTVNYSVQQDGKYWTYTLSNVAADHVILISDAVIEIPDEDPQYNYYPITISSINAITDPVRGTTRVVEGTNQTITIYPDDPLVTLVTDNGVDISDQLVQHGGVIPDPVVSTAGGASYGFALNASTGYYTSENTNINKSAAVCVIDFNLPVRCLVTIDFINYAEATYDFGVFGNVDVPLSNNYYSAGSSGATITDTNYKLACNTSTYNTTSVQTLTYEIPSGQHQVYIKYSKDDATGSNNDTLQWKIASIEPLESNNYYTYTLQNVSESHSLIFIFGDVTYYFVNSNGTGAKLYPSGSTVQLPGDSYRLTIVPDDYSYNVALTDNNVDKTAQVERVEEQITKDGSTYTIVNYVYRLSNIQTTHNIVVTCFSVLTENKIFIKIGGEWKEAQKIYVKENNTWKEVSRVFKKVNGFWAEQTDRSSIFDSNTLYKKGL